MSIENWVGWAMIALGAVGLFYGSCKTIGIKAAIGVWVCTFAAVSFIFAASWLISL